jgi:HD superfamily phosphohydrolase
LNKKKIFNDPIYGFISVPNDLIFDLIEHPYFQRLRRIKQLGLTSLVYPGALHTRFQHAMGAMHLVGEAIEVIRSKGHRINEEEATAVRIAVLLHDIGHGPFSHALEDSIVSGISHEYMSELFMEALNKEFKGKLSLAIEIFNDKYNKHFLHNLVSGQLDMDRLDYLKRDSFFTGVSEGVISTERIIKMLDVHDDELVVDSKGIYSIEKFINARRLMYWQVYLHKTVVSAEILLVNIIRRAREVVERTSPLFASPVLSRFLNHNYTKADFEKQPELLKHFAELDDIDILGAIKVWQKHNDDILSILCTKMINRNLNRVEITTKLPDGEKYKLCKEKATQLYNLKIVQVSYFTKTGILSNAAYSKDEGKINLLYRDGKVLDIASASDQYNVSLLSAVVKKNFLYYPKEFVADTE